MNILQILPELRVGGVETGTLDLAKYLVKLGHKAVVVSNGGELVKDLESSGALHYKLPVHKKSIFNIIKTIPALVRIIKKEQIQIVHARSRVPALIAYFACRRTKAVFITTCHGYYKKHPFSYVMGWAKKVIVPSNVIGRHMIEDFGLPYDRITLIPRSVDLSRFKYTPLEKRGSATFNVGIIGRITPIKGHLYFIKAMAKAVRDIPNLKIWIVGDAPGSKSAYKEQIEVLVKRLGLWHCTEFLGTQKDIPEILTHLNLLVLATTTQEAFGRVIIEAQASGVPVVATSVGGVVDIIEEGKTGLLVPASDPENMAAAVIRVYKDHGLAKEMSEAAYKKVKEKYDVGIMVRNTVQLYEEAINSKKILVIKFSSLGDIILSTAAIKAIREKYPHGNKISFLVGTGSKDVLLGCPYIDELLVCDLKNNDKGLRGLLKMADKLRKNNFDIVIDLQNNRKSHLLSRLTLALDRYGYDNKKFGFLLNHRIRDDKAPIDPVAHQFRILSMLGMELKEPHLELWPTQEDTRYIQDMLDAEWVSPHHKIIGINISASPRWITKIWPTQHMVRLCEEIGRRDIRVILTGSQNDCARADKLAQSVKNVKLINACAKTTVNQLACLIKRCQVYVSVDSAPLHVAAAMDTPFVAIFGPTDPRRHLPPAKKFVVIRKELSCSPCYKSKCRKQKCMELIKPEEVLAAIDSLLK
ncbi:MAG: lipopolysaccharide heptosyltransferase II [Candidatus Omnitrophica bacterium]|nr:lipopolysaccharide heptosyltransferase II [Candidatus Omnitrophota bacterium]